MDHKRHITHKGRALSLYEASFLPRGWSAYSMGRGLNQLAWKLEHALFIGHGGQEGVSQNFQYLSSRIQALFPEPYAAQLENEVRPLLEHWLDIVGSKNFVDSANATADHYVDLAWKGVPAHDVEAQFADMTGIGVLAVERIRAAVLRKVGQDDYLIRSCMLGELVDRGVRPTDEVKYECFDLHALNSSRWEYKRSSEFLEVLLEHRKKWQSFRLANDVGFVEEGDDHQIAPPSRPALPRRFRLECRCYPFRRTALDLSWGPDVRVAWHSLAMPSDLPLAMFAYHKKPDFRAFGSLIAQIDEAALAGFSELEGLEETRLETTKVKYSSFESSFRVSTANTSVAPRSHRFRIAQSIPKVIEPGTSVDREFIVVAGSPVDPSSRGDEEDNNTPDGKSKRPRIYAKQRLQLLREYLKMHPDAVIRQIAAATGCSVGAISKDSFWKEHLKAREEHTATDVRVRNVQSGTIESFPSQESASETEVELREVIEQAYRDSCKEGDILAFLRASDSKQQDILNNYLRSCKDILEKFCKDSDDTLRVKVYSDLLKEGDLRTILHAANQIIDDDRD